MRDTRRLVWQIEEQSRIDTQKEDTLRYEHSIPKLKDFMKKDIQYKMKTEDGTSRVTLIK